MINFKDNSIIFTICLSILVLMSFVFSFIVGEDSLGGAKHDYIQNNIFLLDFSENFNSAIQNYGVTGHEVRNLPTFNIVLSQLINIGFEIDDLKYLNLIILILIILFFLKSLKIKYKNLSLNSEILFACIILLSPTIRSLVNYPFPFLWAVCFFIISIFFYLNFKNFKSYKFKNALYCIGNLAIASYLTPNFSFFILIFLSHFFIEYKLSKSFIKICIFAVILSLPALFFLIWKDFYIFKNEVFQVTWYEKFNASNKIIIITSFIFLFFLPYLKIIDLKKFLFNLIISIKNFYIILFFILCILFFNFKSGAGGGIFYQFSNLFFKNNILLFSIFLISLLIFNHYEIYNINNLLIFFVLILYNMQYTIYYKYFDPILIFIFLFLINIDKINYNINDLSKKYFIFYVSFLLINIFKNDIKFLLI